MTHLSETAHRLRITTQSVSDIETALPHINGFNGVCLIIMPDGVFHPKNARSEAFASFLAQIAKSLGAQATLITLGNNATDLVHAHQALQDFCYYQLWVAIKRNQALVSPDRTALPNYHFGAFVHTKYKGSLQHTKTRIKYTYCPACDKTTKDYGGKKHTYNSYGTLISDIWRDVAVDYEGDLQEIIERFADLFSIEAYDELKVFDCRSMDSYSFPQLMSWQTFEQFPPYRAQETLLPPSHFDESNSQLLLGSSLELLREIPDNSVDFAFADPPYNLGKKYNSYGDNMEIAAYFHWCDQWISELARIMKPGRTVAILNIPLWAIRHFLHMEAILQFQNWIVWDALSFPVRKIMPAHYAVICFSKGNSRALPGLNIQQTSEFTIINSSKSFDPLQPLGEGYCLRASCINTRKLRKVRDRGPLTDLWWDIHRLKHNSRRVDHPCQLPPQFMYRLISIFTEPGETVLDCFNGAGTTTLTARQLKRQYIGIEISEKYVAIAKSRHEEIRNGIDPFRKARRVLTEKNSSVQRMPKQSYVIPKKTLQLEVRRIARQLGKLPTREEVAEYGKYDIEYYDKYFASWGEVCAAARHDGMSEERDVNAKEIQGPVQLQLFDRGPKDAKHYGT